MTLPRARLRAVQFLRAMRGDGIGSCGLFGFVLVIFG